MQQKQPARNITAQVITYSRALKEIPFYLTLLQAVCEAHSDIFVAKRLVSLTEKPTSSVFQSSWET